MRIVADEDACGGQWMYTVLLYTVATLFLKTKVDMA